VNRFSVPRQLQTQAETLRILSAPVECPARAELHEMRDPSSPACTIAQLEEGLAREKVRLAPHRKDRFGVMAIEVDHFKRVNDTWATRWRFACGGLRTNGLVRTLSRIIAAGRGRNPSSSSAGGGTNV